jgi:GTP-binding protein SAR1
MVFQSIYETWRSLLDTLWKALGFEGKEGSLVVLGLDNAGKTTLLHRLRTGGDVRSFPPTDRPHQTEKFECQNIKFQAWDMGGHEAVRHLWEDYVCECSAVLFLIDAADTKRLEEASFELDALIGEKIVKGLPVAILLNKCDLEDEAMSTTEICKRIQYGDLQRMQGEDNISIFRISVLRGEGYQSAFRWIADFL